MEIFDAPYFRINKILLQNAGLWPYEKNLAKKFAARLYLGVSVFTLTFPQFYGLYKNFEVRMDRIVEHMALLMYMFMIFLKLVTSILAENKLKRVYDSVAEHWASLTDTHERKILSDYSNRGVALTKGYMVYMITASSFYEILPLTPMLLNIFAPSYEMQSSHFIFNGEFPVADMSNYYLEIFVFDLLGCISTIYVLVTVDTMYTSCVEHCIGLFAIIKHRLKFCTDSVDVDLGRDDAYEKIVEIIKLHTKTIAFIDLLEKSYATSFLVLMGLNMLHCSFISTLLLIKLNKAPTEVIELIRYIGVLGGLIIHLFYVSWPGQKLIDHSTGLFDDAYTNEWYKISHKSQRLLQIMRLRCLKPCQLTAGKIYVMNLANFAKIIQASGSYITIFSSLARGQT